jgi:hypothetical protein
LGTLTPGIPSLANLGSQRVSGPFSGDTLLREGTSTEGSLRHAVHGEGMGLGEPVVAEESRERPPEGSHVGGPLFGEVGSTGDVDDSWFREVSRRGEGLFLVMSASETFTEVSGFLHSVLDGADLLHPHMPTALDTSPKTGLPGGWVHLTHRCSALLSC